jgi:hypothetical protein
MAFKDETTNTKRPCLPKQKNPLVRCRCEEVYKSLKGVGFSYAGAQCMQVVIKEICTFCKKENGR